MGENKRSRPFSFRVTLEGPVSCSLYSLEKAVVIGVRSSRLVRVVAEMDFDSGEVVLFAGMTFLR